MVLYIAQFKDGPQNSNGIPKQKYIDYIEKLPVYSVQQFYTFMVYTLYSWLVQQIFCMFSICS